MSSDGSIAKSSIKTILTEGLRVRVHEKLGGWDQCVGQTGCYCPVVNQILYFEFENLTTVRITPRGHACDRTTHISIIPFGWSADHGIRLHSRDEVGIPRLLV